jgi:hypothetical protein
MTYQNVQNHMDVLKMLSEGVPSDTFLRTQADVPQRRRD